MRHRKEERNQKMLEDRKKGMYIKDVAQKYGLSQARTWTILHNQERWNAEKNSERRRNPDELLQCIKGKRGEL